MFNLGANTVPQYSVWSYSHYSDAKYPGIHRTCCDLQVISSKEPMLNAVSFSRDQVYLESSKSGGGSGRDEGE